MVSRRAVTGRDAGGLLLGREWSLVDLPRTAGVHGGLPGGDHGRVRRRDRVLRFRRWQLHEEDEEHTMVDNFSRFDEEIRVGSEARLISSLPPPATSRNAIVGNFGRFDKEIDRAGVEGAVG